MKSKFYALTALVCAVVMLDSCSMLNGEKENNYSYLQSVSFKYEDDGYGMMNLNGEVIFEPRFKNDLTDASCDRFFAQDDDGLWELYTLEANPKRVNDEKYCDVGAFVDGLCPVTQKDSWPKYINTEGEVVFEAKEYKGKNIVAACNFHDGMAIVATEDDLYGYINETGEMVIAPQYFAARKFYEGKAIVYKPLKPGKDPDSREWAVIDKNGRELFSTKKARMIPQLDGFENDLTVVSIKDGAKYQLINSKGEQVRMLDGVEHVNSLYGGLISYVDEDYYEGIMDTEGNVVLKPEYKNIKWFGGPVVAYDDKGDYYVLDKKGEVLKNLEANHIWMPDDDYIGYKDRILCYPDTAKGYFMDGQGNRLESSIEFANASSTAMTVACTDYDLANLFAGKLMFAPDGMMGIKINTTIEDLKEDHVLLRNGERDSDLEDNNTRFYEGKYLGNEYNIVLAFSGDKWDDDSEVKGIIATFSIPTHHAEKFREAAMKEVEKVAKSAGDGEYGGFNGKIYRIEGKKLGYFISEVLMDGNLLIYFGYL